MCTFQQASSISRRHTLEQNEHRGEIPLYCAHTFSMPATDKHLPSRASMQDHEVHQMLLEHDLKHIVAALLHDQAGNCL